MSSNDGVNAYLAALQAELIALRADPALIQDALFDAEEYLLAELAAGVAFATATDEYGSPREVAAAYVGVPLTDDATPQQTFTPAEPPVQPPPPAPEPGGQTVHAPEAPYVPPGVQAGMATAEDRGRSIWQMLFSPFADMAVYKTLVYMLLTLGTGIAYFVIAVTGFSVSVPMLILIIGIPLFLAMLGLVRAIALFESRLVEILLGTRMPRRPRAAPPGASFIQRIVFWVKDSRTWLSVIYMALMLPIGITYFTIVVVGVTVGVSLVAAPLWAWLSIPLGSEIYLFGPAHNWWILPWAAPLATIVGVFWLTGFMHLVKWIGRGHAAFAKTMLVRLGR